MKIEFIPSDLNAMHFVVPPKPAKHYLPDWYKNIERFHGGKPVIENGEVKNNSVKSCYPFYDASISGYIQETWCDIYIEEKNGQIFANYSSHPVILSIRGKPAIKIYDTFYDVELTWKVPWFPKMPKGWSVIFTSPMNRIDLPFYSPQGIVDCDQFFHAPYGNYPFYLKKGFTGLIPKGTPMYQITPIKREKWKSSNLEYDEIWQKKKIYEKSSYFFGAYKRFFHNKKIFE